MEKEIHKGMKFKPLRLKSSVNIEEFCKGWEVREDGYIYNHPLTDEFISISSNDRIIRNKGFILLIQLWIFKGFAAFTD